MVGRDMAVVVLFICGGGIVVVMAVAAMVGAPHQLAAAQGRKAAPNKNAGNERP
jgi:hypothetical protein